MNIRVESIPKVVIRKARKLNETKETKKGRKVEVISLQIFRYYISSTVS